MVPLLHSLSLRQLFTNASSGQKGDSHYQHRTNLTLYLCLPDRQSSIHVLSISGCFR
ncbi:hypothetical protein DPEC_G00076380 [Dallia pectoralis]|uniref:Uncharacterized protein n=1 Tax=Dallia pectoralis TaxID=75939 RepID=A0ACC2H3X6_DALPE|nr:hypothetical protein DPEC_G00076380 [Dallia pectoralis]